MCSGASWGYSTMSLDWMAAMAMAFAAGAEVVAADAGEFLLDVFDVGAVDADEHDQQAVFLARAAVSGFIDAVGQVLVPDGCGDIVAAENLARDGVDQLECGGFGAQFDHFRFSFRHSNPRLFHSRTSVTKVLLSGLLFRPELPFNAP